MNEDQKAELLAELSVLQSDARNLEKRLKSKAFQARHYHETIGDMQRRLDLLKHLSGYPQAELPPAASPCPHEAASTWN